MVVPPQAPGSDRERWEARCSSARALAVATVARGLMGASPETDWSHEGPAARGTTWAISQMAEMLAQDEASVIMRLAVLGTRVQATDDPAMQAAGARMLAAIGGQEPT